MTHDELVKEFIKIYSTNINREGSRELLDSLINRSDFFVAPASSMYHGAYEGGLCYHSLNVYKEFMRFCKSFPESIELTPYMIESITIITLLHDICKIGTYKVDYRNVKENGVWVQKPYYKKSEDFIYGGHGSKSVYLINKYMKLSDLEAVAINAHMGFSDNSIKPNDLSKIYETNILAWLLHVADESATYYKD